MSRRPISRNGKRGPQLPFALQQKLHLPESNKRQRTQIADRKQRRQEARKKGQKPVKSELHRRPDGYASDAQDPLDFMDDAVDDDDLNEPLDEPEAPRGTGSRTKTEAQAPSTRGQSFSPTPEPSFEDNSDVLSRGSREYSPEIVLDASSRTFKDRQAEDDAEILALEKKLGLKTKQHQKAFDDGFEDLLEGIEGPVDSKKRKREGNEWLEMKRRKVQEHTKSSSKTASDEELDLEGDHCEGGEQAFEGFEDSENAYQDDISTTNLKPSGRAPRVRENPYVAPVANEISTAKYIPPSRRKPPETDTEKLDRLRPQAQGFLNKLSEANIISIVDEFDKLYQTNPRQDVNTALIELLLAAFTNRSPLQNTFIILHAAFLAALYKILGADFGAEMISKLIETFDTYHKEPSTQGKESLNLTSLLANLFVFGVVSSSLVYDHVRLLLSDFGENSAELLLRIMRDCGPQLRSDDPTALKGIVQIMNEVSAKMTSNGQPISIRTRVMMDTITDLKNNKIRQATNAAGATGEHLTRMRKALGALNTRQLRGTEPLGITRSDILDSDKKGKWWLVGASWKGHGQAYQETSVPLPSSPYPPTKIIQSTNTLDHDEIDYSFLFSHHKLTSPIQRSIFIAITSAEDAIDALQRLSKLRLTRKQENENVAPVIIRACRAEGEYNPYYAVLARMLLREKRYKMSFSIALWKFFGLIGERNTDTGEASDEDEQDGGNREEAVQASDIANVARMYAFLVAKGMLNLDILKTLNVGFTKDNASLFLEMLFIALMAQNQLGDEKIVEVFSGVEPRMAKGVAYFLRMQVRNSDLVASKDEARKVKHGCKMARAALAALERGALGEEE